MGDADAGLTNLLVATDRHAVSVMGDGYTIDAASMSRPFSPRMLIKATEPTGLRGGGGLRPWTAPEADHVLEPVRPSSVNPSIRASPRAMLSVWREERHAEGGLIPRAATPMDGTSRMAARLSTVQVQKMKAASLASARGAQLRQVQAALQTTTSQLEALRSSRDGLSRTTAVLEDRARGDEGRMTKLRVQSEKATERARLAVEAEASARAEAKRAWREVSALRDAVSEKETMLSLATERAEMLAEARDASNIEASTREAERLSSTAAFAESQTRIAELEESCDGLQRQVRGLWSDRTR